MSRIRTIIMGAAGRDFHNFNTFYRGNDKYEVVAFTATQIPASRIAATPLFWLVSFIPKESPFLQKKTCLNSSKSTRLMKFVSHMAMCPMNTLCRKQLSSML